MQESKKLHLAEFKENFMFSFFLKPLFKQNTQNIGAGKCFTELVQNQIQLVGKTKKKNLIKIKQSAQLTNKKKKTVINILNIKTIAYLYFITCF